MYTDIYIYSCATKSLIFKLWKIYITKHWLLQHLRLLGAWKKESSEPETQSLD